MSETPSFVPDDIQGTGFFLPDEYEVMGRLWMIFLNAVSMVPMANTLRLVNVALKYSLSFQALHKANSGRATALVMFTLATMADQHLVEVTPNFQRAAKRHELEMLPEDYDASIEVVKWTGILSARIVRAVLTANYWSNRDDIPVAVRN